MLSFGFGRRGEIRAAVADLACKRLKYSRCGHAQHFTPEDIASPRRPNGRRDRALRRATRIDTPETLRPSVLDALDDHIDDLWATR